MIARAQSWHSKRGLAVSGTLGVLDLASQAGLLRLQDTFVRLQKTNFRYPPSLMEMLLEEERRPPSHGAKGEVFDFSSRIH